MTQPDLDNYQGIINPIHEVFELQSSLKLTTSEDDQETKRATVNIPARGTLAGPVLSIYQE